MTIDEAIKHEREVADFCKSEISTFSNPEPYERYCNSELKKCAEEHEQLAEWLEELKFLRTTKETMFREIYDKALEDVLNVVEWDGYTLDIKERIEQLKK